MTYATLMVHLAAGQSNARVLEVAARLAQTFGADVIGNAVCRSIHCICRDYPVPAPVFEEDRKLTARQLQEAETAFKAALVSSKGRFRWRSSIVLEPVAERLAREARAADIVLVGMAKGERALDVTRRPDGRSYWSRPQLPRPTSKVCWLPGRTRARPAGRSPTACPS